VAGRSAINGLIGIGAVIMAIGLPAGGQQPAQLPAVPKATMRPAAPGARLSPDETLDPTSLEAFVDGVVGEAMARRHIAGAAVAVVQDGQTLLLKGYGADRMNPWRAADPRRTLFRLGATSRLFTWAIVRQEADAGHLRLDRPVNLYLPEALRIGDQGFSQPVLVQDLMNETAGFEDRTLGQAYERDPVLVRPLNVYLAQEKPRRVRPPGGEPERSDYGAALAGAALVEVTGKPFEDLAEQRVFAPLGLKRTTFREPRDVNLRLPAPARASLVQDFSEGYRWTSGGLRLRPFAYIGQRAPSGSASASAGDMARLMQVMLTAQPLSAWRDGLAQTQIPGGYVAYQSAGETLSFSSMLSLVRELRLGVFAVVNTDTGRTLATDLAPRIVQEFYAPPPTPLAVGSGLLTAREGYEGPWLSDARAWRGLEGFVDHVRALAWVQVLDDHHLRLMRSSGVSRWTAEGEGLTGRFRGEEAGETLVFQPTQRPMLFAATAAQIVYRRPPLPDRPWLALLLTPLSALLCVALLADLPRRARQSFRESQAQGRAAVLQAIQAVLWLTAMVLFLVFLWGARDPAALMYGWPGVPLVTASSCALLASLLCLPVVLLLPLVWRGGRRVESWSAGRKLAFTFTALVFLAFSVLLADWGPLVPWSA
jgi:CubicO group peptidase (beta-lactamase class C family)